MSEQPADILIADDNRLNRLKLSRGLEPRGHRVIQAEDGRQALALLQAQPFDLVLLDILMPELDGFQVLERIKADPALRHLPVIVISSLDDTDSVVQCIQMGAEDYLTHPFDPILLRARIEASLEKKRLRDREMDYLRQVARLTDVTLDLEDQRLAAEQRRIVWLENLARFLRHELKNPLIGIATSLELIQRRCPTEAIGAYLERARSSLAFMQHLLDGVGKVSSLEAAIHGASRQRLDLTALVRERSQDYRAMYPDRGLEQQGTEAAFITGNPDRLRQMLDKLIANAMEHTRPDSPVRIGVERAAERVRLVICDHGDPLPADRERIFELFVSERPREGNLGLGLYVVRLIAELHGGKVWATEPADGPGAVFTVELPLLKD